ncbi:hypothetical protein AAMO2058_000139600 [Amorphochlora amoebiformis]
MRLVLALSLLTPSALGYAEWMPDAQPFPKYFAEDLTDTNFVREMSRNKDDLVMVEFYADWCPHCQQFAPHYERIAEAYKHTGQIRSCKIDCASNGARMCNMFSVKFFPTLLLGYADQFAARAQMKNATRPIAIPSEEIGQTAENITDWLNIQIGGYAELLPLEQFQQTMKIKMQQLRSTSNFKHRRGGDRQVNMWDVKLATAMALYNMITMLHYDPSGLEVEDAAGNGGIGPGESRKADLDAALGFLDALCTSFPDPACRATFCNMGTYVQNQNTIAVGDRVVIMGMSKARALNGHKGWIVGYNETRDKFIVDMGLIWGKVNLGENNIRRVAQGDGSTDDFFSSSEEAWAAIESRYTICNSNWMTLKKGFQSCQGSWPHTRGYTCGLWTLFHSLVANAPEDYAPNVLLAIEGFIARFFGCDSCRRHFLRMSENIILIQSKKEAVMWLWEAHNTVLILVLENKRKYLEETLAFPKFNGRVRGRRESVSVAHSANPGRKEEILKRKEALEEERAYYRGFLGTGYSWQFLVEVILIGYLVVTYGSDLVQWIREKYKIWRNRRRKAAKHYL